MDEKLKKDVLFWAKGAFDYEGRNDPEGNFIKHIEDNFDTKTDIDEIVQLRMEKNTAINDFNRIFLDNKYMLMAIYILLEAVEKTEGPVAEKALKEFDQVWLKSGRPGKHRTQYKKVDG